MRAIPTGARVFAFVFLVYCACRPFEGFDSYYVVPTALSLLRHGSFTVDEVVARADPASAYAVECGPADPPFQWVASVAPAHFPDCPAGHWRDHFPVAVPILVTPAIGVIQAVTKGIANAFPHAAEKAPHPILKAFVSGDLVGGRAIAELLCAAAIGALAAWVQFATFRRLTTERIATLLTAIFAFGAAQWSVASRNLGQHGLSVLMLSATLYCAVRALEQPRWIGYAGFWLALAFTVRPSNCVAVAVFTLYVAAHYRKELPRFAGFATPVAVAFFARNLIELHAALPNYFRADQPDSYSPALGFAMNLVSPSRGVFVFTPVFLFSLVGVCLAWQRRWIMPLAPYCAAVIAGHAVLISPYWPGHSYGPRYFSDMSPFFTLLLLPAIREWQTMPRTHWMRPAVATLFLLCATFGAFAHGRGAMSVAANQWNSVPANIDQSRWRVWDWNDPQFLRGLR